MAYSGAYRAREPEPRPAAEEAAPTMPETSGTARRPPGLPFDLGAILKKTEAAGLETGDLLMALILYLMYRESGDIDLLIMLGVMLLT